MINAAGACANDSVDPWDRIELDAPTCALAEEAAARAGLSPAAWLERAIRRTSANVVPAPNPEGEETVLALTSASPATDLATTTADDNEPVPAAIFDIEPATIEADDALRSRPSRARSFFRWATMAITAILAIVAGVVSAQYLIPAPGSAVHVALAPPTASETEAAVPPQRPAASATAEPAPVKTRSTPVTLPEPTPPSATVAAAPPPETTKPKPSPAREAAAPVKPAPKASAKPETSAVAARKPAPTKPAAKSERATAKAESSKPPSDPRQLARWLEAHAKNGDAVARYRLGVLYALGEGVTQDYERAAGLFKSAAEQGVTEAEYNIAVMYAEGLGIKRDPKRAVEWYRKAAAQGSASAAFNLGVAYSNGVGVKQSMSEAAQWFGKAAEAGVVNAQFNLGLLYERGEGVAASPVEAYAWYSAAAARGDSGAEQRRDHLASKLSPAVLREARERAAQLQDSIQTHVATSRLALPPTAPAARKP